MADGLTTQTTQRAVTSESYSVRYCNDLSQESLPSTRQRLIPIRSEYINSPISQDWHDRPVLVGSGAYATAIGNRLAQFGVDTILFGRNQSVVDEINTSRTNSRNLPGKVLSDNLRATTFSDVAFGDRGTVVLAVPSIAISSVVKDLKIHPDSILVSMAKGLIIDGWDPLNGEHSLRDGPPSECNVQTPLQFLATHTNTCNVEKLCVVAGPGFASDILDGDMLDLAVASHDEETCQKIADLYAGQGTVVDMTPDTIGVEVAAAMKNVIAVMVGVVDGLNKRFGSSIYPQRYVEVIKRLGLQEAAGLATALGGKHRTFIGPAGYPDLNLTTSSPEGRNFSLGRLLAEGVDIDQLVRSSGRVVEGAWSAWGVKRLSDDKDGGLGVYMPVTNALIDIFRGDSPDLRVNKLIQELSSDSFYRRKSWRSGEGVVEC